MNLPGKRLLLGTAIAVAALGAGGVAYAAGNDPAPEQGYVTVEEGSATSGQSTRDCPEKDGSGGQQGGAEQGAQPSQPQGEQQPDVAGNA
ncbi:hypothetical protein [Kribbella sp. CA-293567]|uniref:hypothetical protein n=1 Tax=Kribbella sp. CA-293567 TaxID=3002436 RepID=UPI0022DD4556|nr:hypothetical protein [Kribbella sp. CA-293567]WBQ04126.1 hypothetical protein OX958_29680 [Kribbella sp. CA-293567]